MPISLGDATKIMKAAVEKVKGLGIKVSVVVINSEGHVISLSRMDEAGFLTPNIALGGNCGCGSQA